MTPFIYIYIFLLKDKPPRCYSYPRKWQLLRYSQGFELLSVCPKAENLLTLFKVKIVFDCVNCYEKSLKETVSIWTEPIFASILLPFRRYCTPSPEIPSTLSSSLKDSSFNLPIIKTLLCARFLLPKLISRWGIPLKVLLLRCQWKQRCSLSLDNRSDRPSLFERVIDFRTHTVQHVVSLCGVSHVQAST